MPRHPSPIILDVLAQSTIDAPGARVNTSAFATDRGAYLLMIVGEESRRRKLTAASARLTAEQARQLAAGLIEAADEMDAVGASPAPSDRPPCHGAHRRPKPVLRLV